MNMLEIIEKKKFGRELSTEEIRFFADAAAQKTVPDYQLAALLMAIRLNGMTDRETTEAGFVSEFIVSRFQKAKVQQRDLIPGSGIRISLLRSLPKRERQSGRAVR